MAIIRGTSSEDTLTGLAEADNIKAYAGNDYVDGADGNDTVNGNAGDDTVLGGLGNDTVYGGNGNDSVDGGEGSDKVYGGRGNDMVFGGEGADSLYGGADNDTLDGGAGNDRVYGGNGSDMLIASTGNDTLNGGDGTDAVVFSGNRADYTVSYVNANVVIITDAEGNQARVVKVESFQFADVTQSFAEVHQPYENPDELFIGTAADEIFDGGAGNDTLAGDNLNDVFFGGDGVDTFDFSDNTTGVTVVDLGLDSLPPIGSPPPPPTGNLYVTSTDNFDILSATGRSDGVERMIGTDHNDQFQIINGDVTYIDAGAGDDIVLGSQSDDTLLGGSGNDQMGGLDGDDLIITGDGFDFVFVDRDTAFNAAPEGDGHDVVTDFDPTMDMLIVQYDAFVETYDPFADLTQTAEGALLSYTDDASILLEGVNVSDLNAGNLTIFEDTSVSQIA